LCSGHEAFAIRCIVNLFQYNATCLFIFSCFASFPGTHCAFSLFFIFSCAGDRTQDLTHTRQVLYHQPAPLAPFSFS
jgi:hypothetical protein